jgi:membrane protease YdiL (CAAX protease family)
MTVLFILALMLKILDSFVLRLDDRLGELIFSKSLGFVLVVAYLWACGRRLRDIGFHRQRVGQSLLISGVCFVVLFAISHLIQLIALRAGSADASLALAAVDPKTGRAGGLLFALWLIFGNVVNSAMEEGLFRGAMLRHFRLRLSPWRAILLQAAFFAVWHLNWPVKNLLFNGATLGESAFEALGLLLSTSIAGVVYGYLYHKTGNLWGAYLAHFINNTVLNVLFFRTAEGLQLGPEFGLFLAIWLPGYLLLIPLIKWWAERYQMPEVTPWDSPQPAA